MDFSALRLRRGKKNVSRNERAGKYSNKFALRSDARHGLVPRMSLAVLFVICGLLLLPPTQPTQEVMFKAGEIADRDVIAPFNFKVPLSEQEMELARSRASLEASPVYRRRRDVEARLTRELTALLDTVTAIINIDTLTASARTDLVASWLPSLSREALAAVVEPRQFRALNKAAKEYQKAVYARGLIDNAAVIRRNNYPEISVVDGSRETTQKVRDVLDQSTRDHAIREEALARFGNSREMAHVFSELLKGFMEPNYEFDVEETTRRRTAATNRVRNFFEISKNERIIGEHDKVTSEQERILSALEDARVSQEKARSPLVMFALYASEAMRLLIFGLLLGGFLFVFHRPIYSDLRQVSAVFCVMLVYMVLIAVVVRFGLNQYLVPAAFASVLIAALFNINIGLIISMFAALLIPLVTQLPPHVAFASLFAGAAGVIGVDKMRSRSHVYSIFIHVAGAYVIAVFVLELGMATGIFAMSMNAAWGIANGVFSSVAVMFLLPIFETVFGRTSRFTLLELTDLNKPILKRLVMEAHGTYHHSMLIGNLVDTVAESIGADPLKTRVMAYYHDIGKMFKPEYFAENQMGEFNKHEKITAQMSALILVSHVKDGVELAREEKLPSVIIDGIREHHGTAVMAYFYQKALETDSHSSVNKDDFRYPGPKPQTKETGLLMCADTVEAAVRSLKDPTPTRIRNMVSKLVDDRARNGELDECQITLNDLNIIKDKFTGILSGIYHKRIAYPGQEEPAGETVKEDGATVAKSI